MGSQKRDLSMLASKLLASHTAPTWTTPQDLERISFESFASEESIGRQLRSSGRIRLTGDGVQRHSASLEHLGILMSRVQRLVSAIGGAEEGFKGLRGRLPATVISRTKLHLNAGAKPGSVIFDFEPATIPGEELYKDGVVPLIEDSQEMLVDRAMKRAIELVSTVGSLGPDADGSDFLAEVSDLGPRATAALAEVAKSVSIADFDLDIEWREPHKPTSRSHFSAQDATRLAQLVAMRELDSEVDHIVGLIHTISDISRIHVQTDDQEVVSIKPGKIGHEELAGIRHGQRVEVTVDVKVTQRAGEEPLPSYLGRSIRLLGS